MIWPDTTGGPAPNADLNNAIQTDFEEARRIVSRSPRGAAALLRLCVQKLCVQLGETGKDINADIGNLVKKGLATEVQEALDALRVIGNNAVHPGQFDLKDDPDTAEQLFELINFTANAMLTEPKKRKALFDRLPTGAKDAIAKRDKKSP